MLGAKASNCKQVDSLGCEATHPSVYRLWVLDDWKPDQGACKWHLAL